MFGVLHSVFRQLPPPVRSKIKRLLGSEGHGESTFDWITALKDASGKKRLDRVIEDLSNLLGSDISKNLAGKVCVDLGAGYVPMDGVALWILGAREVFGVDYNYIAKPRAMARAVRQADFSRVEYLLAKIDESRSWSHRLETIRQWAQYDGRSFPPGYRYIAPADIIASPQLLPKYDLIVSVSVLEHIRPSLLPSLLGVLSERANDRAIQIHRVDLRDHRDFENNPYGFLYLDNDFEAERDADARGNGMTIADWNTLLERHPEWGLSASADSGRARSPLDESAATALGLDVVPFVVLRNSSS